MSIPAVSVEQIKKQVLPELFANPAKLGEYGGSLKSSETVTHLSDLMERGAVSGLASLIAEILSSMAKASPEQIAKKPSWLDRFLGGAVERQVQYQTARKRLETQLADAEALAQGVRDTVTSIDNMIDAHAQVLEVLVEKAQEIEHVSQRCKWPVASSSKTIVISSPDARKMMRATCAS